jgi:hypothetical protein
MRNRATQLILRFEPALPGRQLILAPRLWPTMTPTTQQQLEKRVGQLLRSMLAAADAGDLIGGHHVMVPTGRILPDARSFRLRSPAWQCLPIADLPPATLPVSPTRRRRLFFDPFGYNAPDRTRLSCGAWQSDRDHRCDFGIQSGTRRERETSHAWSACIASAMMLCRVPGRGSPPAAGQGRRDSAVAGTAGRSSSRSSGPDPPRCCSCSWWNTLRGERPRSLRKCLGSPMPGLFRASTEWPWLFAAETRMAETSRLTA